MRAVAAQPETATPPRHERRLTEARLQGRRPLQAAVCITDMVGFLPAWPISKNVSKHLYDVLSGSACTPLVLRIIKQLKQWTILSRDSSNSTNTPHVIRYSPMIVTPMHTGIFGNSGHSHSFPFPKDHYSFLFQFPSKGLVHHPFHGNPTGPTGPVGILTSCWTLIYRLQTTSRRVMPVSAQLSYVRRQPTSGACSYLSVSRNLSWSWSSAVLSDSSVMYICSGFITVSAQTTFSSVSATHNHLPSLIIIIRHHRSNS